MESDKTKEYETIFKNEEIFQLDNNKPFTYLRGHKNAFFLCNMVIGDMIVTTGIVEHLTTIYNTVTVVCRAEHAHFLYKLHEGNAKIRHFIYKNEFKTNNLWTFPRELTDEINKTMDIYAVGHYSENGKMSSFPSSYYDDCNIPIEYMKSKVNIKIPIQMQNIYNELKKYGKYVVLQQNGSTCSLDLINNFKININRCLTIDVNKNLYQKNHKFYEISNKFINLQNPFWYKPLLENAFEIYMIDSCLHALTFLIDISHVSKKICAYRSDIYDLNDNKIEYVELENIKLPNDKRLYKFKLRNYFL
jgi:hypothetical protein